MNFREPALDSITAIAEFERQRSERLREIGEARARIRIAKDANKKPDPEDEDLIDQSLHDRYTNIDDPVYRVGKISYLRDINGIADKTRPLLYEGEITDDILTDGCVINDPTNNQLDLHASLSALIDKATRLGMNRTMLDSLMVLFVRNYIPASYGSVRRLTGESLFLSVLGLGNYHTLVSNLLRRLGNVVREVNHSPDVALFAVRSIATELTYLSTPNIKEHELNQKLDGVLKKLLPKLISPLCKHEYVQYLRGSRIVLGKDVDLTDRLMFINNLETDVRYQITEPIRLKSNDINPNLFDCRLVNPLNLQTELNHVGADTHSLAEEGGREIMEELYYTAGAGPESSPHQTRSNTSFLPGTPLHGVGDRTGRLATPGYSRGGGIGGNSPVTYSGVGGGGQPQDVVTRALIHSPPPGMNHSSPVPPAVVHQGGQERTRPQSPRPRWNSPSNRARSKSPGSGKTQLYRRGSNGSPHPVDRGELYKFSRSRGFVPRTPSGSPNRKKWTKVSEVPSTHCKRCFRYCGPQVNKTCTPLRCLRYLEAPILDQVCRTCEGGFHDPSICGRKRTPSNSPARGFNSRMSGN